MMLSIKESLGSCSNAVDKGLSEVFGRLGKLVAERPWATIVISILLTGVLAGTGFSRFATENDPFELYVPSSARKAQDDVRRLQEVYGMMPIHVKLLVYSKEGSDTNLLKFPRETLEEMMDMWDVIVGKTDDKPFSPLQAICIKPRSGRPCITSSILALWDFNRTKLENDDDILGTINSGVVKNQYGKETPISENLGGIIRTLDGRIAGAKVFYTLFALGDEVDTVEMAKFALWLGPDHRHDTEEELEIMAKKTGFYPHPFAVDDKIAKLMEDWGKGTSTKLQARMTHLNRVRIESDQAITRDMLWAGLALALVFVVSSLVLWRNSRVHCKSHLAIVSMLAIIMALLAGFGFTLLIGVKFNLVVAAVPFLIIGLGIDDTFIIMGHYRRVDPNLSPSKRVSSAISKAGPSIFITSITDLIAFLISLTSSIPALRAFCVYASFGVLFDFLFQVTFFVAFVALEARREQNFIAANGVLVTTVNETVQAPQCHTETTNDCKAGHATEALVQLPPSKTERILGSGNFDASAPSISSKILGCWLPSVLFTGKGMAIILGIEAVLLAGGIYGCTKATTDFKYREWFTPKNSWLRDGFQLEHELFSGNQAIVYVYTTGGSHYYNQNQMLKCVSEFENSPYMSSTPRLNSWFKDYMVWKQRFHPNMLADKGWASNSTVFHQLVIEFLDSPEGIMYYKDVKFNEQRTQIVSTKLITGFSKNVDGAPHGISMMVDLRKEATNAVPELTPVVLSDLFPIYEGLRILKMDTVKNLIIVAFVVLVIISVMLANVKAAFLVSLMLAFIDVILIGLMFFVGLAFNMVTSICIVLAIGITVDYSVHIAHNFLIQTGTNKKRASAALEAIGGDVLCGAGTSWLAVMGLAFTQTYTMQVFFKMLTAVITLGAWHGMIVLPVLLVLLGPAPYMNHE